jgi:hypothetical protein
VNHRKRQASKSAPASEGSLEICRQHDQCGPFRTKLPNIFARFRRYHAEVGLHLILEMQRMLAEATGMPAQALSPAKLLAY